MNQEKVLLANPIELPEVIDGIGIDTALQDPVIAAYISYYQKAFKMKTQRAINNWFRNGGANGPNLSTFKPLQEYTEQQKIHIMSNVGSIQLTYGCNGGCPQCGLDAIAGTKEHIPFETLNELFVKYREQLANAKPFLYWASDPLDYRFVDATGEYTYIDVERMAQEILGYKPYVSTVIPKGSEDIAREMDAINRVSQMPQHKKRHEKQALQNWRKVDRYYTVEMGNIRLANTGETNQDAEFRWEAGIGCYQGALVSPRGVYSVAQAPGMCTAAPQRQFVIPYAGNKKEVPVVGVDIRSVLQNHIPLLNRVSVPRIEKGTVSVPSLIIVNTDHQEEPTAVIYEGTKVTRVCPLSVIENEIRPDLSKDYQLWEDRRKSVEVRRELASTHDIEVDLTRQVEKYQGQIDRLDNDPVYATYTGFKNKYWNRNPVFDKN